MNDQIRILLVEDDPDWVEGIRWVIEKAEKLVLLGSVATKKDALELLKHLDADVVLLDVMLNSKADGITAIQEILDLKPELKIIMMSSMEDGEVIWESFSLGAVNYIVKSSEYNDIPDAIREAYYDEAAIHPSSASIMRNEVRKIRREKFNTMLTNQERKILYYVDQGKTTSEIQQLLSVEVHTIENYISGINKKLKTKNRREAANTAKKLGLLDNI